MRCATHPCDGVGPPAPCRHARARGSHARPTRLCAFTFTPITALAHPADGAWMLAPHRRKPGVRVFAEDTLTADLAAGQSTGICARLIVSYSFLRCWIGAVTMLAFDEQILRRIARPVTPAAAFFAGKQADHRVPSHALAVMDSGYKRRRYFDRPFSSKKTLACGMRGSGSPVHGNCVIQSHSWPCSY